MSAFKKGLRWRCSECNHSTPATDRSLVGEAFGRCIACKVGTMRCVKPTTVRSRSKKRVPVEPCDEAVKATAWSVMHQGSRYVPKCWPTRAQAEFVRADLLRHYHADSPWHDALYVAPCKHADHGDEKRSGVASGV